MPGTLLLQLVVAVAPASPALPPPPIPADYELRWTAPPQCPGVDSIRARIEALRGAPTRGEGTAIVVGEVTVTREGYALALTTSFAERTHVRRIDASACADLGESTAIVVAVALRRGLEVAMSPGEPEPQTRRDAVSPSIADAQIDVIAADSLASPSPQVFSPDPRAQRARPEPLVRLEGLAEIGVLGVVTGGPRLTLGLGWQRARAELYGLWLAPRVRQDGDDRGARFQAGAVGIRGCWVGRVRTLALPVCGGFEAGTVRVDTRSIVPAKHVHTPWVGPSLGVALAAAVGPVRVWVGIDAVVRVVGSRFRLDGEVAFTQWPVSPRASLGLEIPLRKRNRPARRRRANNGPDADNGGSASAR
jgi:hypothetical protein